ncbi:hypothetical protein [Streptomyces sp. NPDC049949]|uniref:hypothetical protein n=1 Tax=Streptomyces sp. NPDC049949 TaxID=3154627 RepID=UPI00343593D7
MTSDELAFASAYTLERRSPYLARDPVEFFNLVNKATERIAAVMATSGREGARW